MSVTQIYQDASLYGHALTSLPQKLEAFSQKERCWSKHLDSLARDIERREGWTPSAMIIDIGNPLIDLIELASRRILGRYAAAASILTLVPIGFVVKVIHFTARHINTYIASTWLAEKASQIWNDGSLYGHYLTCLPKKLWAFAVSDNLVFYTTGRVFWILEKYRKVETAADGSIIKVTEVTAPPLFTYAESGFRRIVGTCLTAGTCITAAPLGFAIKIIHKGILMASSK